MGEIKVNLKYEKSEPCSSCPYRKQATLKQWDYTEFESLLYNDKDPLSPVYACHTKKLKHVCVGWLMDQRNRGLPSLKLRLDLMVKGVPGAYLDGLKYAGPHFSSIQEMCNANYPEYFDEVTNSVL